MLTALCRTRDLRREMVEPPGKKGRISNERDFKPPTKRQYPRVFCPHCNEYVSKSTYYNHRGLIDDRNITVNSSSFPTVTVRNMTLCYIL